MSFLFMQFVVLLIFKNLKLSGEIIDQMKVPQICILWKYITSDRVSVKKAS